MGLKNPREGAAGSGDVLMFLFPPMNICFQASEGTSPHCEWEKLVVTRRPAFMTLEASERVSALPQLSPTGWPDFCGPVTPSVLFAGRSLLLYIKVNFKFRELIPFHLPCGRSPPFSLGVTCGPVVG